MIADLFLFWMIADLFNQIFGLIDSDSPLHVPRPRKRVYSCKYNFIYFDKIVYALLNFLSRIILQSYESIYQPFSFLRKYFLLSSLYVIEQLKLSSTEKQHLRFKQLHALAYFIYAST